MQVVNVNHLSRFTLAALLKYMTVRNNHPDRPSMRVPAVRVICFLNRMLHFLPFCLAHRALAAVWAISLRRLALNLAARAAPPTLPPSFPSATACLFFIGQAEYYYNAQASVNARFGVVAATLSSTTESCG